jgi:hypothetical protein
MQAKVRSEALVSTMDAEHAGICRSQLHLLSLITEADGLEVWRGSGARDMAHWVAMRYGISEWKARRWIDAACRLPDLSRISAALAAGAIGIDKVAELTRFATSETQDRLLRWAQGVSTAAIRRRADLETRKSVAEAEEVERSRTLAWWYFDEGRRFGLGAELPAAQRAIVARALERLTAQVPAMPGEEGELFADRRRADALVILATRASASDTGTGGATVVVHAKLEDVVSGESGCEVEGDGVTHAETARRLLCSGRLQTVIEDSGGNPLRLGRSSREALCGDDADASSPRRRVPVSRMRRAAVHQRAPHPVVVRGRADRPRQPRSRMRISPPAGARVRVEATPRAERCRELVQTGGRSLPGGTGAAPIGYLPLKSGAVSE